METARWDLIKGDRDRLIEVQITIIKGHKFRDFEVVCIAAMLVYKTKENSLT